MDFFEIMMFILGAAFFILSFFVDRGKQDSDDAEGLDYHAAKEEFDKLNQQLREQMEEASERVLTETETKLSTISNETILSVDDFSKQTLERTSHNHEEVVFMYHMLQTKEDEIKKLLLESGERKQEATIPESVFEVPEESGIEMARKKAAGASGKNSGKQKTVEKQISVPKSRKETDKTVKEPNEYIPEIAEGEEDNKNRKIIELYRQKKTILEISKQLGLGQGEVKLVIDLYGRS